MASGRRYGTIYDRIRSKRPHHSHRGIRHQTNLSKPLKLIGRLPPPSQIAFWRRLKQDATCSSKKTRGSREETRRQTATASDPGGGVRRRSSSHRLQGTPSSQSTVRPRRRRNSRVGSQQTWKHFSYRIQRFRSLEHRSRGGACAPVITHSTVSVLLLLLDSTQN